MKLLNFSIGQVQTVEIRGEPVRTAHVKTAVPEPWVITPDGAQGDQRAVHPDKIYAYARSHYQFWGRELSVDPAQWPDGFFGENLTFDALDEGELRLGDVFALGEDVRLVVAGPRHPCAKLCWRLDQPPTFQKVFQQSQHAGVYFGVLNPGNVRPGDVARCIERDEKMPTMVEMAKFVTDHATPPLEPLQRVLACKHLSGSLRFFLQAKLDTARRAAAVAEGRWRGWRTFNIERIVDEAPEIRSYYLRPANGGTLCQPRPGQFVSVQMQDSACEPITRSWSLSSYAESMDHYRLTVRQQQGIGSNWLHRAKAGASVRLRSPTGEFVLDTGSVRPMVLIAAGIGITPLFAMLQAHLTRGPKAPPAHLIYGARTPAHVAFRQELDAIVAAHPEVRVHYVYSQSDAGERPAGRITSELVTKLLSGLHVFFGERRIALPWYESDIYLCGPGDFCTQLKQELVDRGANPLHIFLELFVGATVEPTELEQAEVTFERSGITTKWSAAEDLTLLELAEQAGIKVENDCRAGTCLTCRTRIVDGQMTADLSDGSGLLCIGRPKTPHLRLDC
jgi:uncharacterized protein